MRYGKWILIAVTSLVLVGCGEGNEGSSGQSGDNGNDDESSSQSGYSGSKSAATVDESNKSDMVVTSSIGAEKSIESSTAPKKLTGRSNDQVEFILNQSSSKIKYQRQLRLSSRAVYDLSSSVCNGGGSASYTYDENNTTGFGTFTISYNDCQYSYGGETSSVDGTAIWTSNEDGSFSYEYDITTTYGSETYTVTATYVCDAQYNCSYNDDFSYNGVNYQVADLSVSGNSSSGFDVTAKVYHETYGYIKIEGEGLISCPGGGFSSGTITVEDSTDTDVLTITYVSCSEMTVTFNNVSSTVVQ